MNLTIIDVHNGIRFEVEAVPRGALFEGRFTLLEPTGLDACAGEDGTLPGRAWPTALEAVHHATEAAQRLIDRIPPFSAAAPPTE